MKNSDMPAMPTEESREHFSAPTTIYRTGLTKREYAAIEAMKGFIAKGKNTEDYPGIIAQNAIKQADALLKELE